VTISVAAIDFFCGIGGLTHGLIKSGLPVLAGFDIDESCRYAYEKNNNTRFINADIEKIKSNDIAELYPSEGVRVLAGCAPCQPFSKHTQKYKSNQTDERWGLLYSFLSIIDELEPEVVTMENVPTITKHKVFKDFVSSLIEFGYEVSWSLVYCPRYGIPQKRTRLVLFASKYGKIKLIPPTCRPPDYKTVWETIGDLPSIEAGEQYQHDPLHRSANLSELNLKRLNQSKPGGTWLDWHEDLRLPCHSRSTGKTYSSVYGRMKWNEPSPTITTNYYTLGTGRFGHPKQNRALSIREGALLQTFPHYFSFLNPTNDVTFRVGRHIGNAVPVKLGIVIGTSIINHIKEYLSEN